MERKLQAKPSFTFATAVGRRARNEDMVALPAIFVANRTLERVFPIEPQNRALFAQLGWLACVCDGVGSHETGARSSALAVQVIAEHYYGANDMQDIGRNLREAVQAANAYLWQCQQQTGMPFGTTVVAAVCRRDELWVASVGDSRAYLYQDGLLRALTIDHNLQATNAAAGNRLTRCLGTFESVGVDIWHKQCEPGDRFLLCTDGVSGVLDLLALERVLQRVSMQQVVNELVDTAFEKGSTDNLTAVLGQFPNLVT